MILLSACAAPTATVSPTSTTSATVIPSAIPTVTPSPTFPPEPTATPEAYRIGDSGAVETWNQENGVYEPVLDESGKPIEADQVLKDADRGIAAAVDANGRLVAMFDLESGQELPVTNGILIVDGQTLQWDGDSWVKLKLTEASFMELTPEQRQSLWEGAPEAIDGLTKSNFSTLLPYLIIYRDQKTEAQQVLNLLTQEKSGLIEAGIAEFTLTGKVNPAVKGTKGEMWAFAPVIPEGATAEAAEAAEIKALEAMLQYMVNVTGVKWGDIADASVNRNNPPPDGFAEEYARKHTLIYNLPDAEDIGGVIMGEAGSTMQNQFILLFSEVLYYGESYTLVSYRSPESEYHWEDECVLVAMPPARVGDLLSWWKVAIPPKPED